MTSFGTTKSGRTDERSKRLQEAKPYDRSRSDGSTERGRYPQPSREAFGRGDRPDVPQRLCTEVAARTRNCVVFPRRGLPVPSAAVMSPMSRNFVAKLESYAAQHEVPLVQFRKGQRKDEVMAEHLRKFQREEGVVFVGKAQEKTPVFRTEKRKSPTTGRPYPWIVRSTAMVNHYYVYAFDRDFGPFFLKFCSYFPFNAKLCLNGHEYAKC